jgi:hypothetical protein
MFLLVCVRIEDLKLVLLFCVFLTILSILFQLQSKKAKRKNNKKNKAVFLSIGKETRDSVQHTANTGYTLLRKLEFLYSKHRVHFVKKTRVSI